MKDFFVLKQQKKNKNLCQYKKKEIRSCNKPSNIKYKMVIIQSSVRTESFSRSSKFSQNVCSLTPITSDRNIANLCVSLTSD